MKGCKEIHPSVNFKTAGAAKLILDQLVSGGKRKNQGGGGGGNDKRFLRY